MNMQNKFFRHQLPFKVEESKIFKQLRTASLLAVVLSSVSIYSISPANANIIIDEYTKERYPEWTTSPITVKIEVVNKNINTSELTMHSDPITVDPQTNSAPLKFTIGKNSISTVKDLRDYIRPLSKLMVEAPSYRFQQLS
jgi:hypothetical protein